MKERGSVITDKVHVSAFPIVKRVNDG